MLLMHHERVLHTYIYMQWIKLLHAAPYICICMHAPFILARYAIQSIICMQLNASVRRRMHAVDVLN